MYGDINIMNKKNRLTIILVFLLISSIRIIGIENIPFGLIVIIQIACIIVMFLNVFKFRGDKKEHKYLLVVTLLLTLFFSVYTIVVSIEKGFPQISEKYKPIFIILMLIIFSSLLIVILINSIIKYNRDKNLKK